MRDGPSSRSAAAGASLTISNLDAFDSESHALRDVGMEVKQGERVTLSGNNGPDAEEDLLPPNVVNSSAMSLDGICELFPNQRERGRRRGAGLADGAQRMLAIARILRTGADVILLDEPVAGAGTGSRRGRRASDPRAKEERKGNPARRTEFLLRSHGRGSCAS